jgi:hypothetical protein
MPGAKPATVAAPAGAGAAPAAEESTKSGMVNILRTVSMFFLLQYGMSLAWRSAFIDV